MALVEEGLRQQLRQRFSHLPEPVFNECLRTNPSNLDLCISQLRERSLAQAQEPMPGAQASMEPARLHQHHPQQVVEATCTSLDGRENSDDWVKIDWPPAVGVAMQSSRDIGGAGGGGDGVNHPPNRTREADGHWQDYRNLYNFKPPTKVSKLSVTLGSAGNRTPSPRSSDTPPSRTERGSDGRTPSTPDSAGLDMSILLPGVSPPSADKTPSPSVNPFFPPVDPKALRASQSNGRSSPGSAYNPGNSSHSSNSSSPRHTAANKHYVKSPSTQPTHHYNSSPHVVTAKPPLPAVVQHNPSVVTSHPVTPHQLNTPVPISISSGPDVRRKTPTPTPTRESDRWADPFPGRGGGHSGGAGAFGQVVAGQGSKSHEQRPTAYVQTPSPGQHEDKAAPAPAPAQGPPSSQEELAYNQALIMHQKARKERLQKDLDEEKAKLERMRVEVQSLEQDLNMKRASRSPFPTPDQLGSLREELRQLQIDIECMNKEIDMFRRQGLTYIDTGEQQYFYRNINSGPEGPISREGPPAPTPPAVLDPDEGQNWNCQACTFLNHPFLDKCECCEMPRDSA